MRGGSEVDATPVEVGAGAELAAVGLRREQGRRQPMFRINLLGRGAKLPLHLTGGVSALTGGAFSTIKDELHLSHGRARRVRLLREPPALVQRACSMLF